jgi:Holliday junction resolvase-like predicted endonuclease
MPQHRFTPRSPEVPTTAQSPAASTLLEPEQSDPRPAVSWAPPPAVAARIPSAESPPHAPPACIPYAGIARAASAHVKLDGLGVAIAWVLRRCIQRLPRWLQRSPRDPGERAAERFLHLLGHRVLARNWRSARDPRDEADLLVQTPDGREVVVVEVKRTASTWDALARVNARKREVLWRIALDLERYRDSGSIGGRPAADDALGRLRRALREADTIRVDMVAVRGDGRACSVADHIPGILSRRLLSHRRSRDAPDQRQ